jgi:hypothetical protein
MTQISSVVKDVVTIHVVGKNWFLHVNYFELLEAKCTGRARQSERQNPDGTPGI